MAQFLTAINSDQQGQTDLEVFVEKLQNRSDPEAILKFLWKNFKIGLTPRLFEAIWKNFKIGLTPRLPAGRPRKVGRNQNASPG